MAPLEQGVFDPPQQVSPEHWKPSQQSAPLPQLAPAFPQPQVFDGKSQIPLQQSVVKSQLSPTVPQAQRPPWQEPLQQSLASAHSTSVR